VRGILDRPIRLFDDACAVPAMERRDRRFFGLPVCESLRFESRPRTVFPESFATAAHDPTRRNHFARAYRWSHGRGDHPAVLCIHGYRGGFPGFDGRAFDVPRLFGTLGFDVVLATLPYHGARAPEATGSGARFLDDPLRTLEAVVQAIGDLRAIAAWLRSQGASSVGVIGMSLGGYLAALLASVEPTLDFAVPVIPVASFADILWDRAVRRGEREDAQAAGVDLGLLRRLFSVHCPLSHSPVVAERRRLVIAGEGDRIVPPQHPAALAAHWRAPLEWFPGGHLLQLGRERALRRLAEIAAAA
jgi:pimeloyl-ACP methyl ester carboxylesterase